MAHWHEEKINFLLSEVEKSLWSVLPSAGWGESRQDDKLCLCVLVQWMSSLCALFSMTAQTDAVWPLVWSVEEPAMTHRRADVAERRPHSPGIVQTLSAETEIGRDADRRTLAAFVLSVKMFGLRVAEELFPPSSEGTWSETVDLRTGTFVQTRWWSGKKKQVRLWLSNQLIR